jgi:hypothetical protein
MYLQQSKESDDFIQSCGALKRVTKEGVDLERVRLIKAECVIHPRGQYITK